MKIIRKETAPRYKRDSITSYLLAGSTTTGARYVTTTLVEMDPGGIQKVHAHPTEQCYMILQGQGRMTVADTCQQVKEGDTIFIPSNTPHGLENTAPTVLRYLSAGSPTFGDREPDLWPLPPLADS